MLPTTAYPPRHAITGNIHQKGHEEQYGSDDENTSICKRASWSISHGDLDDEGRHGLHRHARIERKVRLLACGDRYHHCFSNGARYRQNDGSGDPATRCGQYDTEYSWYFRSTKSVRSFT